MQTNYFFPFGEPVKPVEQQERTPKTVFILGVYASAVHARWIGADGKTKVTAMAVASEPYIFWRGDDAESIIERINIPNAVGRLVPASSNLNGPSGIALDERFIEPLGLNRRDTWLCDLVPHSCMNNMQRDAIDREYRPLADQHGLPEVTLPPVPKTLADEERRKAILNELVESKAEVLMLLGNEPLKWFLSAFDNTYKNLAAFGDKPHTYGRLHPVKIANRDYQVLPVVHPRQAARLGAHSGKWHDLHAGWVTHVASNLLV